MNQEQTPNNKPLVPTSPAGKSGVPYLLRGASVLLQPGYRRYIVMPVVINIVIFTLCVLGMISLLQSAQGHALSWLPNWLSWLEAVFMGLGLILFALIYLFFFTAITNLIAAPFNGLLSEKLQRDTTGEGPPPETLAAMARRTFVRELQKMVYFLGRSIVLTLALLVLSFVPILNMLAPIIGVSWACWVMGIQFIDYAADNNHTPFATLRVQCRENRRATLTFGGCVMLAQLVPILNLFVMTSAVAGGTLLWLEQNDTKLGKLL